ncbi:acetyl-CoA carboxylase biotin carboxyl carrier protein [Lactobacillus sp. LC28-10]|uniref:Biotin carboxyl carrier protein of acetyl-CoA carboxylase n=1 Tax=Secundilactobacillus angelensis TaxID=2722706 RepID=A0ABX1L019_9LACO|nr:acetyl-CoA carboxylase biotin carboxyl carrier protein [Secundilactobacillus angelensis]MCH5463283.1 acetyl-CoA carboxylase biotin carboxyl carrier protein [Secundilactobacillus angelensis]NLR19234.1 acetyl-CoA carboxylase biotin carboxyl carrier protein [Secundilactobacillus angelensis]
MTLEEIQAIIRQINDSDIREINLDYQDIHLYLSKNKTSRQIATKVEQPASLNKSDSETQPVQSPPETTVAKSQSSETETTTIKAPLVGVIYLQPSPDKPAYKQVGDHVSVGEVVCVIEAMKMMTEIKSKVAGTISKILVDNEEVVEYDQPMFEVTK